MNRLKKIVFVLVPFAFFCASCDLIDEKDFLSVYTICNRSSEDVSFKIKTRNVVNFTQEC